MQAITATQAERVIVTHGSIAVMLAALLRSTAAAGGFETEYGDDEAETRARGTAAQAEEACVTSPACTPARRDHLHQPQAGALQGYFARAAPQDAAWAAGAGPGAPPLRQCAERAGLDEWLFDECYHAVGDLAETIALILPAPAKRATSAWPTGSRAAHRALRGAAPEAIPRCCSPADWDDTRNASCSSS
jgi:hypothetical protein